MALIEFIDGAWRRNDCMIADSSQQTVADECSTIQTVYGSDYIIQRSRDAQTWKTSL